MNRLKNLPMLALPVAAILGLILVWAFSGFSVSDASAGSATRRAGGEIETVAGFLFRDYLLPFEVTSILILVAVLGAMVLAKRTD
jgi:NADH-quinone oxidoreductase subunit J